MWCKKTPHYLLFLFAFLSKEISISLLIFDIGTIVNKGTFNCTACPFSSTNFIFPSDSKRFGWSNLGYSLISSSKKILEKIEGNWSIV